MAMEFDAPTEEEVKESEGNFLSKGGTYHFSVIDADENPQYRGGDKKGQMRDGFEVEASVVAGPLRGKSHRFFLRNPNLAHKDGGRFCKVLQGMFLEALAITNPADRGKRITVELSREGSNGKQCLIAGRQFIATLKPSEDPKYLELDGTKVWHVDDPAADQCERDQNALKLLPKSLRRDPASFKPAAPASGNGSSNGNGSSGKSGSGQQAAMAGASAGNSLLDDI